MKLNARVEALEAVNPISHRWHRIFVDGQSEQEAIRTYEAANGSIGDDNVILRTIVSPSSIGA